MQRLRGTSPRVTIRLPFSFTAAPTSRTSWPRQCVRQGACSPSPLQTDGTHGVDVVSWGVSSASSRQDKLTTTPPSGLSVVGAGDALAHGVCWKMLQMQEWPRHCCMLINRRHPPVLPRAVTAGFQIRHSFAVRLRIRHDVGSRLFRLHGLEAHLRPRASDEIAVGELATGGRGRHRPLLPWKSRVQRVGIAGAR